MAETRIDNRNAEEMGYANPEAVMADYLRAKGYDPDRGYYGRSMIKRYSGNLPTIADVMSLGSAGGDAASKLSGFRDMVSHFVDALTTPGMTLERALGVPLDQDTGTRQSFRDYASGALESDSGKSYLMNIGMGQAQNWLSDFSTFMDELQGYTPAYRRARQEITDRNARNYVGDFARATGPRLDAQGNTIQPTPEDWIKLYLRS